MFALLARSASVALPAAAAAAPMLRAPRFALGGGVGAAAVFAAAGASCSVRAFAHGKHKFAANGAKKFKKNERPVDANSSRKSVRLEHKMKRLLLKRQREGELTKMAQAGAAAAASAVSAASASASSSSSTAVDVGHAPKSAAPVMTEEERRASLFSEVPLPAGVENGQLRFGVQKWMVEDLHPSIRKMLDYRNASNKEVVQRRTLNWAAAFTGSEANVGDSAVQSTPYSSVSIPSQLVAFLIVQCRVPGCMCCSDVFVFDPSFLAVSIFTIYILVCFSLFLSICKCWDLVLFCLIEIMATRDSFFVMLYSDSVASLTERIRNVTDHMRANHKDMHSRYGLDRMLNRRRRLMWYLRRKDFARYTEAITKLGLTDLPPPLNARALAL